MQHTGPITALAAVAIGLLVCLWGYRLMKVTLAIAGVVAGATAGWDFGLALFPGNQGLALICAVVLGVLGGVLCLWLFWLGVFLLGASAGAVMAAAAFSGAGYAAQPWLVLACAIVFGLIVFLLQKLLLIFCTAVWGSYLVAVGVWQLIEGTYNQPPLWFGQLWHSPVGILEEAVLALWIVLAFAGIVFQIRGERRSEALRRQAQPA